MANNGGQCAECGNRAPLRYGVCPDCFDSGYQTKTVLGSSAETKRLLHDAKRLELRQAVATAQLRLRQFDDEEARRHLRTQREVNKELRDSARSIFDLENAAENVGKSMWDRTQPTEAFNPEGAERAAAHELAKRLIEHRKQWPAWLRNVVRSPKTSTAAIAPVVAVVLFEVLGVDIEISRIEWILGAAFVCAALFARDGDTSSQDVGIRPKVIAQVQQPE